MYLKGFPVVQNVASHTGVDPDDCRTSGGIPRFFDGGSVVKHRVWSCQYPPQQRASTAPANISVSVPTNVQTQVSPQISPNLVQQQQPKNSPVSAASAQKTASDNQEDSAQFTAYLEEMEARRQADNAALYEAVRGAMQPPPPPPAPVVVQVPESAQPAQVAQPFDGSTDRVNSVIVTVAAALAVGAAILYANSKRKGK